MNEDTYSAGREWVDSEERRSLEDKGVIFLDPRRTRPLWFDGRFLKAQDLNQEQNYFLTRQADLAFATGTGVIKGLMVRALVIYFMIKFVIEIEKLNLL